MHGLCSCNQYASLTHVEFTVWRGADDLVQGRLSTGGAGADATAVPGSVIASALRSTFTYGSPAVLNCIY